MRNLILLLLLCLCSCKTQLPEEHLVLQGVYNSFDNNTIVEEYRDTFNYESYIKVITKKSTRIRKL